MSNARASATAVSCAIAIHCASCAHDIRTRYPRDTGLPTGSITVLLTRPARDLTVAINGVVVAERTHTRKVTVTGVPAGSTEVIIAAGGGAARIERHVEIWVESGENVSIPLGAPEQSMTSTLHMGMLTVAAWLLSRAIYLAFF
jgi:hypothetical protein